MQPTDPRDTRIAAQDELIADLHTQWQLDKDLLRQRIAALEAELAEARAEIERLKRALNWLSLPNSRRDLNSRFRPEPTADRKGLVMQWQFSPDGPWFDDFIAGVDAARAAAGEVQGK